MLATMRDTIPRLEAFISELPKHSDELNNIILRLAHRDRHFAKILYNAASSEITSILEAGLGILRCGVVYKWNPSRSFLWNRHDNEESGREKQQLLELFGNRCKESGITILEDANFSTPLQESTQQVTDFLRAIREAMSRD